MELFLPVVTYLQAKTGTQRGIGTLRQIQYDSSETASIHPDKGKIFQYRFTLVYIKKHACQLWLTVNTNEHLHTMKHMRILEQLEHPYQWKSYVI